MERTLDRRRPVVPGTPDHGLSILRHLLRRRGCAHAALFITEGFIDDAYRCCVYADTAFDQSPL